MKTSTSTRLFGLLCAAALSSCANQSDSTRMPVSASLSPETQTTPRSGGSMRDRLFDEVNSYRVNQGERAVQRDPGLDRLAQAHCEYLRNNRGTFSLYGKNVSHYGFEGRASHARQNLGMLNVSENVAAANYPGQYAPSVLLELWKNSKDHHVNMLEDWNCSGIGVVVDSDGMVFATQIFATRNNSQLALRNRMNSF